MLLPDRSMQCWQTKAGDRDCITLVILVCIRMCCIHVCGGYLHEERVSSRKRPSRTKPSFHNGDTVRRLFFQWLRGTRLYWLRDVAPRAAERKLQIISLHAKLCTGNLTVSETVRKKTSASSPGYRGRRQRKRADTTYWPRPGRVPLTPEQLAPRESKRPTRGRANVELTLSNG